MSFILGLIKYSFNKYFIWNRNGSASHTKLKFAQAIFNDVISITAIIL